jgi:serine phosphatase RsbU (regulator of sigma subunit)
MNYSLRSWLTISFTTVILISLTILLIFIKNQHSIDSLDSDRDTLQRTRIVLLETNRIKEDLFLSELINSRFYEQNPSPQEKKLDVYFNKTTHLLQQLQRSKLGLRSNYQNEISNASLKLVEYRATFKQLISLFKYKGYKNYGIEGEMRDHIHRIMKYPDQQIKYYSLLLRRNEKDFIIRKEIAYITNFNTNISELIGYLKSAKLSSADKKMLLNETFLYNRYFKLLARLEHKIGIKGKKGLLNLSSTQFEDLHATLERIGNQLNVEQAEQKGDLKVKSIVLFVIIALFLIITVAILTNLITQSVTNITNTFSQYINSGFSDVPSVRKRSLIKEFNVIYIDFIKMAREINTYTNFFKEKVYERTLEINKQKEEIQEQQKQIEAQYTDLLKVNHDLMMQKKLLKDRNVSVLESLRYAKRIQKALLPKATAYNKAFPENFVFSKAKDVVSGDFNLLYRVKDHIQSNNDGDEQIMFIAADSTGHGVPGAFISVLGINSINKLVNILNIREPGQLLDHLDKDINYFLSIDKKHEDVVVDGMDISVFSFNTRTYKLKYSVAKYHCIIIRNMELLTLYEHSYSIGYDILGTTEKKFFTHNIQMFPNDRLYLFSDGFFDQFGGADNKKYKKRNFLAFLMGIHQKPMKEQKIIIKKELKNWKGNNIQTDDVTVIGLRF